MRHTHRDTIPTRTRAAFTLLETLLVTTIIVLITAVAIPTTRHLLDSLAVRAAADDVVAMLQAARHTAMTRAERISVDIESAPARLTMRAGVDTLLRRNETATLGAAFRATRSPVVYIQTGMALGVSNTSVYITRGAAAETVVVSRLGRVRR